MNFISESQLEENKRVKGERVEDGTITVDKPLYEILREQKEKKDAEHKEKFKHQPPRALDEDEVEFLEAVAEKQREDEKEKDDEDKRALTEFQAALLSRTVTVDDHTSTKAAPAQTSLSCALSGSASMLAALRKRKEPELALTPRMGVKVKVKVQPKVKARVGDPASRLDSYGNSIKAGALERTCVTVYAPAVVADIEKDRGEKGDEIRGKDVGRSGSGDGGGGERKDEGCGVGGLGLAAYGSDDEDDDNE